MSNRVGFVEALDIISLKGTRRRGWNYNNFLCASSPLCMCVHYLIKLWRYSFLSECVVERNRSCFQLFFYGERVHERMQTATDGLSVKY